MQKLSRVARLALVAGLALAAPAMAGLSTIAQWDFENASAAINNNPTSTVGSGTASSIGMDVYGTPNVGVTTDDVVVGKTSDTGNTVKGARRRAARR